MADITFIKEELQKEFRMIQNNPKIIVKSIEYPDAQKDLVGAHFAASIDFMNVTLTRNGGNTEEIVPIFVKRNPKNAASVADLQKYNIFMKEGEWYRTISKRMIGFCEKISPAIGEKLKSFIPVCYYTDADSVVVMNDLSKQDYRMYEYNMLSNLQDLNHVKYVMEFFGVLHGIGYVMKKRNLTAEFQPFLTENLFAISSDFLPRYIDGFYKSALPHFEDVKHRIIIQKCIEFGAKVLDAKAKPCEPFTTVNHGDSWNNNMLFKYDVNGNPVNVKFVDWQCTRYCSSTVDLNYFLFSSTTAEFRKNHLEEVLKYYYNNFTKIVMELTGTT